MALDPDVVRLTEEMIAAARTFRFGTLIVEVATRYEVDVREGKVIAAAVREIKPRVTVEQLRRDSVLT